MSSFKNLPCYEMPRERLINYGCESLSNEELIAIIIRTGCNSMDVKEVSNNLLKQIGDISFLKDVGINSLMKVSGIGKVKAIELKASIELGRRVYQSNSLNNVLILNSSIKIYESFYNLFIDKKQEYFYAIYVDSKNKYIDKKCLFVGTINKSIVHPREVFKEAYLLSANAIICMHNHPSGDVTPSKEDILLTKKLVEIGIIHGIKILDHLIIGNNAFYSFFDNGNL